MQASLVALVAALAGIILERAGSGTPYLMIFGDALIMGAFIIAITSFLIFLRDQLLAGGDQIVWTSR
jgi:Mn2+/Fe2+ NRAMP family transporter